MLLFMDFHVLEFDIEILDCFTPVFPGVLWLHVDKDEEFDFNVPVFLGFP